MDSKAPRETFVLHPQLERDTALVGDLPLSRLLLMDDANFPWLIVVPRLPGAVEIFDLGAEEQTQLLREVARLAEVLKSLTGCDKINIATIGNMVPQLHVHVVARSRHDLAWPRPVWGAFAARPYDGVARDRLIETVRQKIASQELASQKIAPR